MIPRTSNRARCPACHAEFAVAARSRERGHPAAAPSAPVAPEVFPDDARPRPAPKRRPRKEGSRRRPRWVLPAAIGGGVLLAVVALIVILVSGGGTAGGPADVASPQRDPGPKSRLLAAAGRPAADPATWAVRPDPAAPPAGLRSAFPLPEGTGFVQAVVFSAPAAAQAAILVEGQEGGRFFLEWLRFDLRSADPLDRITVCRDRVMADPDLDPPSGMGIPIDPLRGGPGVTPGGPVVLADLSPTGDRLAFRRSRRSVEVWSKDKQRLLALTAPDAGDGFEWLGFPDDNRLATLAAGKLTIYEVPSGKVLGTAPGAYRRPVAYTPNRKYVVAFTGDGFAWLRAGDGRPAGKLPLPPALAAGLCGTPGLALAPDGKTVAAALPIDPKEMVKDPPVAKKDIVLLTWDVASGKPGDGVRLPVRGRVRALREGFPVAIGELPRQVPHAAVSWCGPRALLLARRYLIDLDLAEVVWEYDARGPFAAGSPDGRLWYLETVSASRNPAGWKRPDLEEALKRSGSKRPWPANDFAWVTLLLARTAPHPALADRLAAAKKGSAFCPARVVRVEVEHPDREFCGKAAAKLADLLAGDGFRVDPAAPVRARLKVGEAERAPGASSSGGLRMWVTEKELREMEARRREQERFARLAAPATLELVDAAGRVVWTSPRVYLFSGKVEVTDQRPETLRAAFPQARDQFAESVGGLRNFLPDLVGADEGRPVHLPARSHLGADGLPEPPEGEVARLNPAAGPPPGHGHPKLRR